MPAEHAQERAPAPAQADDQSKQQQQKIDKLLADVKKLQAEADKWKQEAEQAKYVSSTPPPSLCLGKHDNVLQREDMQQHLPIGGNKLVQGLQRSDLCP